MDKIIFAGMQFYAYHGAFPEERKLGQIFQVDVEVDLDLQSAGESDSLAETINYADLFQLTKEVMENEKYQLIEAVAENIAGRILAGFEQAEEVLVRVTKPTPPIPGHYTYVAVEIRRQRKRAE